MHAFWHEVSRIAQRRAEAHLDDLSFHFALNTDNRISYGPVLEDIIYCHTKSKGHEVSVGRIGPLGRDLIPRDREMSYAYVQVAMTIMDDPKAEDRACRPPEQIRDNYPKFTIMRNDPIQHGNGIAHEDIVGLIQEGRDFS